MQDNSIAVQWLIVIAVILFFGWLRIDAIEWMVVLVVCGVVVIAEYFNTVLERLLDFVHRDHHPAIERLKDMSAGAVLVSAMMALSVGLIIVVRHIDKLLP